MIRVFLIPLFFTVILTGCEKKEAVANTVQESALTTNSLKLGERFATLRIATEPRGVKLFVDGQYKGNSPSEQGEYFSIKLAQGIYTIEAKKDEGAFLFLGRQEDVFVADHTEQNLMIRLDKQEIPVRLRLERQGYVISNDGMIVTDKNTGLMWMRCLLGQEWDGEHCSGKAQRYSWEAAGEAVQPYSYGGYRDWQLPSIDEASTLVQCSSGSREAFDFNGEGGRCLGEHSKPTTSKLAFYDPLYWYTYWTIWTASPDEKDPDFAWVVEFFDGATHTEFIESEFYVRLVRKQQ